MAALAILGRVYSIGWAENIFMFGCWYYAIVCTTIVFHPQAAAKACEKPRPAPQWLDVGYDISMVIMLAAFGWFVMATLWVIQAIGLAYISEANGRKRFGD